MLLKRWDIPKHICDAVQFHHSPDLCPPENNLLCQTVHLADTAISSVYTNKSKENISTELDDEAWYNLGLDSEDTKATTKEITEAYKCADIYTTLGLR